MPTSTEQQQKYCDLLRKFDTGMLVTHSGSNLMHGRPMAVADVEMTEQSLDLWFLTGSDTPKTNEIRANEQVLVCFQDRNDQFLTLTGRAEARRDPQKVDQLWRESFKIWFPQGQQDPNLMLIRVQAEEGEYWDNGGLNKVSFLAEAMKAFATGDRVDVKEGSQHGKVSL